MIAARYRQFHGVYTCDSVSFRAPMANRSNLAAVVGRELTTRTAL